jgi:PAS domain S-box-containing protein
MSDRGGVAGDHEDPISVLYVDDDPEFAALAAEFLGREDDRFEITTEDRSAGALDRLRGGTIDCIVSDYDMPGMGGLELLDAARELRPGLPFVLVTGKGSEEIASEAVSAGVTDYLQKRGGREQYAILANRIRNAVAGYRAEREAAQHRRVSDLVRDVTRALVGAASREEIEQAVCDQIADSEPYRFAWVGSVDESNRRIRPRTSAGVEDGYLDDVTITDDESPTGQGPAGTALREGRVAVAQNVQRDPSFAPWREQALDRGFRAVAGVPLGHDGTTHGVLVVYADHADAFDDTECALLRELGDAVGHAIDAIRVRGRLEQQYNDLFETAPVMYALTRNDRGTPTVVDCNQRLLDRLGYDRETVVDRSLAELYTAESTAKLLDEGGYERALDGEFTQEERRLVTADGEVVETLLRAVPRYDDEGETAGTLTLFVDVTERRLARAREMQATAMEAAIDGMAVLDADGTFRFVNDAHARMYGYEPERLVGENWRLLYDDDRVGWFEREVMPAIDRGEEWRGESVGRRADGSRFPQELSLSPLGDGRFVCVVRDVTERKAAERELERQNRRLDEFASLVSHDLRNPLNIAQGNTELARATVDAEAEERLDTVERALDRMDRIIGDVLSLARGIDESDLTPVSLERTAASCWHGADELISVDGDLRFVADRGRLQRLLENLFRNAVEHGSTGPRSQAREDSVEHGSTSSRPQADDAVEHGATDGGADAGDVTVRLGPLPDAPGFFVEDDGPGVPEAERESVFEFGYTTSEEGTGLGLGIVRRIAETHGWDYRLTTGRDGGARFEFAGVDPPGEGGVDAAGEATSD